MAVADKYEPVDARPRTLSAPGAVIAGAWALGILVALASPATLRAQAVYATDLPEPARELLRWGADLGAASPLGALRATLDGLADPLDRTTRWFRAPDPTGGASEPEVPRLVPVAPEDTRTPAERWAAVRPHPVRRVLLVGASSIQYAVGTELERLMADTLDVALVRQGKVATGLTRDDVFDWPAEVASLVDTHRPDVVIGQFGGNDGQNIVAPDGAIHEVYTDGWAAEYGRRIAHLAAVTQEGGARLVLLGMPIMRSGTFSKKIRWLNEVTQTAVEAAGGLYVDVYNLGADAQGAYKADVTVDGRTGRMRLDDGIHFTRLGGQYVARHLLPRLLTRLPMPPKAVDGVRPATLVRVPIPAAAGRPAGHALAFVPSDVPDAGLPWIVVLHGAWSGPGEVTEQVWTELATLSAQRGVVLALPDGGPHGWWLDAPADPSHTLATWLRGPALTTLATTLPVDPSAPAAIVGLSMGGHGALLAALDEPDRWAAVGAVSAVVDLRRAADQAHLAPLLGPQDDPAPWATWSALSRLQRSPTGLGGAALWLGIGEADRHHADNVALHDTLTGAGVDHAWRPLTGGHDWDLWRTALPQALRWAAEVVAPAPVVEPDPPQPAPAGEPG